MTFQDTWRSARRGRVLPDRWRRRSVALAILAALAVWAGVVALIDAAVGLDTGESGLLERAQTAVLVLVAAVWWRRPTLHASGPGHSWRGAAVDWWASAPVLAVVGLAGAGREISWGRVWKLPEATEPVIKAVLAALLVTGIALSARRWWWTGSGRWRLARGMAGDRPALLILSGLVAFGVADLFERRVFGLADAQLLEETLELFAYACVLGAGRARSVIRTSATRARPMSDKG